MGSSSSKAIRIVCILLPIAIVAIILTFIRANTLQQAKKEIIGTWAHTSVRQQGREERTETFTLTFRADGTSTLLNTIPATAQRGAISVGSDSTYTLSADWLSGFVLTSKEVDRIADGKRAESDMGTTGKISKDNITIGDDTLSVSNRPWPAMVYTRQK